MRPILKIAIGAGVIWWLLRNRKQQVSAILAPQRLEPVTTERPADPVASEARVSRVASASATAPAVQTEILKVETQGKDLKVEKPQMPEPVQTSPQGGSKPLLQEPQEGSSGLSVPVLYSASTAVVLDDAAVLNRLSPSLRRTIRSVQPTDGSLPFDSLSRQAKDVLLRGYASDYVAERRIKDDEVYDAAVFASTKSGLPIGWTQALAEQGVGKDGLLSKAVEVVQGFDELLAAVSLLPGDMLDLKTLRDRALTVQGA